MKVIRKLVLGLALVAATATVGQAQQGGNRGMNMTARLLEGITLTADQQTKVDSIQKAFAPKLQAARDEARAARESGGDPQAAMQKMRTVNEEQTTALRSVLTADQQVTFDKNQKELEARRREMMQNRGGPPGN